MAFHACTGAISDHVFSTAGRQVHDALGGEAVGDRRWDVVSLSMGGADIGFSDVIFDCVGLDAVREPSPELRGPRPGLQPAFLSASSGWSLVAPSVAW